MINISQIKLIEIIKVKEYKLPGELWVLRNKLINFYSPTTNYRSSL